MKSREYFIYDVFTERPLAGNPLAVVTEAQGLDAAAMQAIAREFNLSETVFILPPGDPRHRARLRIFTPGSELPFAGHPTVGSAVALAEQAGQDGTAGMFVLEETVGPVRCIVTRGAGVTFAEFDLPRLPVPVDVPLETSAIAAALGIGPHEVGFENHRPGAWSAGVPYVMVPVADRQVAARIQFDTRLWNEIAPPESGTVGSGGVVASAYVYCRDTLAHDSAFHTRMFWSGNPSFEDPATGSAAAAFAGAILRFDAPGEGSHSFWLEQGIEMNRPSRIRLEMDVKGSALARARIGGHAVRVAEGRLFA